MKTFNDLELENHPGPGGRGARMSFPNGFALIVVRTQAGQWDVYVHPVGRKNDVTDTYRDKSEDEVTEIMTVVQGRAGI